MATAKAKAKETPAPEPENEYVHTTETGNVVTYDADTDRTLVESPNGTVREVDGDHYDNAVAVATLFGL